MVSVTPWSWEAQVFLGVDRLIYTKTLSTKGLGGDANLGNGLDVWVGAYSQQVCM